MFGGNTIRWGAGHDCIIKYLDAKHENVVSAISLCMRSIHFPSFDNSLLMKCFSCWKHYGTQEENRYENNNKFNACGILDVTVFETCRLGSRPLREGHNIPRRPSTHMRQILVCDERHKLHGLSDLTFTSPTGMRNMIGIFSTINCDGIMPTSSDFDNMMGNLCTLLNLSGICCFYADIGLF